MYRVVFAVNKHCFFYACSYENGVSILLQISSERGIWDEEEIFFRQNVTAGITTVAGKQLPNRKKNKKEK